MLMIVITHVRILEHLVDRNMQESCKNAPKMFKNLQYEILLEKLLGGTCILYSISTDCHIYSITKSCKKCRVSTLESVKTI